MQKNIQAHNISIEIFNEKPDIKFNVVHSDDGEMFVFPKEESAWKDHPILQGKITIGAYSQLFFLHCDIWNIKEYQDQWQEGLARIDKYNQSCLVTKIHHVRGMPSMDWWVLYKIEDVIHVQCRTFLGNTFIELIQGKPFTPATCYDFILPRQEYEDDGEKIPEIIVNIELIN